MTADDAYSTALAWFHAGQVADAERLLRRLQASLPNHPDILHMVGLCCHRLGDRPSAIQSIRAAIHERPNDPTYHFNLGVVLQEFGQFDAALGCFAKTVQLKEDFAEGHSGHGNALCALGRYEQALESYAKALFFRPDYPDALLGRASALQRLARFHDAVGDFSRYLRIHPTHVDAYWNRAACLQQSGRLEEALADYSRMLTISPGHVGARQNRAAVLLGLNQLQAAADDYYQVISQDPTNVHAHYNLAVALVLLQRWEGALAAFDKVTELAPMFPYVLGYRQYIRMHLCQWDGLGTAVDEILQGIREGKKVCAPFPLLAFPATAALQKKCAEIYVEDRHPHRPVAESPSPQRHHDRIRVAYVSADFHDHATAHLLAGLIERHDRCRFDVIGISYGVPSEDAMRERLVCAFDSFIDTYGKTDDETTDIMRSLGVDIAIDLKGFTSGFRAGIFARRVAPVQVSYLGYPGTSGAPYIDYLIADPVVIPEDMRNSYSEKIAYLPCSYQVNDSSRSIPQRVYSREQVGLPVEAFVFCCFNNNYKITPDVFDIWMRLLNLVEGSVLWLLKDNETAAYNLRREAEKRGIGSGRIIFADRLNHDDHLARHRLADLFLDTLICNAHTTASDALWMGIPIVTCLGTTFHARVAASLLSAVGLPELIAASHEEYERMALQLAADPVRLADVKARLNANRVTHPLFNTEQFTRRFEGALTAMWKRHLHDEPPDHIAVTD